MTRLWRLILGARWSCSAAALPASVTLKNIRHDHQTLNNRAPVTALTVLGYCGASVTQAQAAAAMKDYPGTRRSAASNWPTTWAAPGCRA